ncbi:hypothetical protein B9S53_17835 [Arthrospira sp. O9.13F]|uniref:Uncharacterized protein n=1 Tax=Limnospira indica PCC 8005 TaxID=376219 RepID=A0A9P1KEX1_9CYAN|nr:hypothetical protein [Limnospira indica]RAQ40079.1 hypothetical protein B9S53_17835 [Arthrospira sp. O9.13F]CDM95464.1 conserved protein of unknown function [Limnospira indica PCC 8005]
MSFSVYSSALNLDTLNITAKIPGTPVTTAISLTANTVAELVAVNANTNGRNVFIKNRSNVPVHLILEPTKNTVANAAFSVKPGDTVMLTIGASKLQAIAESVADISVTLVELVTVD